MQRITIIVLTLYVCSFGFAQMSGAETIVMGYFDLKPHMYKSKKTGQVKGASVAYFEKIAEKMGCDVKWIGPLPFSRLIFHLKFKEMIDGTPLMSMTEERKAIFYYPKHFYYLCKPNLIVRSDNTLEKITSVDDLKKMTIGQFSKAANSRFITANHPSLTFDIVSAGLTLFENQLNKLINKRIDAIHTLDEYTLLFTAKLMNIDHQVKILFLPEAPWPFYTVFSKTQRGKMLVEKFDQAFIESGYKPEDYHVMIKSEFDRITDHFDKK
ncbi:putative extracellular solute-binding protein, family 3 [Desulfosarcina variabilis str. Montpellier]|uniref:substrate-binding periplasmic protein n=1 Tax=Desulfosarcina variabilis TaxID=2300 RepID=UPI003AFA6294